MDSEFHKPGLYRWKKQTDSRVYSRSQKVTTNDDIQNWIKKVEEASNRAAEQVFGTNHSSGRARGRAAAKATKEHLQEHDQAHSEAQDLLSQWMEEKVILNDNTDDYDEDDPWRQRAVESDVKREWDHLLANNYEEYGLPVSSRSQKKKKETADVYANIYDLDTEDAVDTILQNMLQKEVVKESFSKDLGLDGWSKHKDPRTKMELRHQQVKENREKRQQELEKRRREIQSKKEAQHKAKKIVLQEEKDKVMKARREEMEIKKEMAHIRKEMQEDRRREEERRNRERQRTEEIALQAEEQVSHERVEEEREELERQRKAEEKQRILLKRIEELEIKEAAQNLKILQRHFSAWYNVVLERRLHMGKARALSDWKLLLRAWNAWKSYIRTRKLDQEESKHKIIVIETHRKNHLAEKHCRTKLLRKYFVAWQVWIRSEQERRELQHAQSSTRNKMAALLEAAASGRLWGEDSEVSTDRSERSTVKEGQRAQSARSRVKDSTADKMVNALFEQSNRPKTAQGSAHRTDKSSGDDPTSRHHRVPTQAWQITKKHIQLSPDEIARLGGGDPADLEDISDRQVRKRFGKQPWLQNESMADKFQHRHDAQKKILQQQQKQIKEQQRLIEELQFKKTQQELQEQLNQQQAVLQHLTKEHSTEQQLSQLPFVGQQLSQQPLSRKSSPGQQGVKDKGLSQQNSRNYVQCSAYLNQNNNNNARKADDKSDINTARSGASAVREDVKTARSDVTNQSSATSATNKTNTKYLTVLKNMEERAAERARLKAEREEKKRIAEEQRLAQLQVEEEERLRQEEEEKRARIEAYREKKRLEKQKGIEKKQNEERMKQLMSMADVHYQKSLLKWRGLMSMKKLVLLMKEKESRAKKHYHRTLLRHTLKTWQSNVREVVFEKEKMADEMAKYILVKQCFHNWKNFKYHFLILEKRAQRYHSRNTKIKVLHAWAQWAKEEKAASIEKDRRAGEHFKFSLLRKTFQVWRHFNEIVEREKEKQKRREEMRLKVAALLPDYEARVSVKESTDSLIKY